ncbi:hypothetical protein B9479_004252 [Cryptococcus floricola]|uniref:Probable cytosolic iron-sulfur protein assembly protein 1 n=1 Tax=Cryptococcus floricola TaxID=2591691 RepID=A0A5D3AYF2_9TREE|nr:hypothetical protein B9479_004252 [Cryptococcus floricola]
MPELQELASLPAHADPAWTVKFNPTRPLLASCSTDRTIRLFSYILPSSSPSEGLPGKDDPQPVFSLMKVIETEHKRTVRSIAWSPDGRTLASGSFDSTVGVWEEVVPTSDDEDDGDEGVYKPEGSDDDDVGGSKEKEWECVATLEGHESECKSVGFSSDGALLASCSRDKSVWVWEVQPDADFECIAVMMEHSQDVKGIAWHPHEEILASASYDSNIHLAYDDPDSDWYTFQKLHPSLPLSPPTLPALFRTSHPSSSPSSSSSSAPQHLIEALLPTQEEQEADAALQVPELEEDETVWCVAWSADGGWMVSGGDTGGLRVWRRTGSQSDSPFEEILHLPAHTRSIFSLAWSPPITTSPSDLGLIASGGGDGKIIIWQVTKLAGEEGKEVGVDVKPIAAKKNAHGVADINSVSWCVREDKKGAGLGMLSSAADDGSVRVWRVVRDD